MIFSHSPLKQRFRDLGERFTAKEKPIHDQGLVTVLRQIHDELDAAGLDASRRLSDK